MSKKNSFIFYNEYVPDLAYLDGEDFKTLMFWLSNYQATGCPPDEEEWDRDPTLFCLFCVLSRRIDYDDEKYQERIDRNQNNGKKGGRPKTQNNPEKPKETQNNPEKPNHNPSEPRKSLMDMDMVMDMDISTPTDVVVDIKDEPAPQPTIGEYSSLIKEWNAIPHVTKIREIIPLSKRDNELRLLLSHYGWKGVYEGLHRIRDSEYLQKRGNVSFDTYMKTDVFQKVLEGSYDEDYSKKGGTGNGFEFGWDTATENHDPLSKV